MLKRFPVYAAFTSLAMGSLFADAPASKPSDADQKPFAYAMLPSQPCPDAFRLTGTYLYMLPTIDDTYFVIDGKTSTPYPSGKIKNNDFNFHSGFRVGAEYASCDTHRGVQAFYTYLSANQHRQITGENLWATLGEADFASAYEDYTGSATSKLRLMYQRLDLNLSQQALDCFGVHLYIQPGIEAALLNFKEHYDYSVTGVREGDISQKSRLWGVGPQLGLGIEYNFFDSRLSDTWRHAFGTTWLFSGSILMSHAHTKTNDVSQEVGLAATQLANVKSNKTWRTIPALHARAGLNYTAEGPSVGFLLSVGYEFNTYVRGLTRVIFADDVADGKSFNNYYNFDVQGLYVTAGISF